MGSALEGVERSEIGRRQRIFQPLAAAAERIVGQHSHDDTDIAAAGTPDGDRGNRGRGSIR
jgi:hypothetical protein